MKDLANKFDIVFPNFSTIQFDGSYTVKEPQNEKNGKLYQLTMTGIKGFAFPHEMSGISSSFAEKGGVKINKYEYLQHDCDGIMLFEHNGQKYILLSELKSTFSSSKIDYAKNQLVGSYMKIIGILSIFQGFKIQDYKVAGIIASFAPTDEQINSLSKTEDKKNVFAISLNRDRYKFMSAEKCNEFFAPLEVGDFPIYYVPVNNDQTSYSVNVINLLNL